MAETAKGGPGENRALLWGFGQPEIGSVATLVLDFWRSPCLCLLSRS